MTLTADPPPDGLRVRDCLELEAVLEARNSVRAGGAANGDDKLVVWLVPRSCQSTMLP